MHSKPADQQQVQITSKLKNNFTMVPNEIFQTGLKPEVCHLWTYFLRCANESYFKMTQEKICKVLNIPAPRYRRMKQTLIQHNMIAVLTRENSRGGSGLQRHQIVVNDIADWTNIPWTNQEQNDSTPNATRNKTFSVNQEQNVPGNQEQNVPGDKTSRKNEKDKTKDDDRAMVDTTSDVGQSSAMHPSSSSSSSGGLEARNLVEEYGSLKLDDPPQPSPARPKVFAPSEKDVRAARARENTLGVGNPLSVNYTAIKSEFRRLLSAKVDGGPRWGELLNLVFREADALPLVKREHYLSATIHIIEKENQNYRSVNPHFQKMQGDLLLEDFKGEKFIHKKAMGAVNKG